MDTNEALLKVKDSPGLGHNPTGTLVLRSFNFRMNPEGAIQPKLTCIKKHLGMRKTLLACPGENRLRQSKAKSDIRSLLPLPLPHPSSEQDTLYLT